MKLQNKVAFFNTLSKVIIIVIFISILPFLIEYLAITNTDQKLRQQKEKVLEIIKRQGISSFIEANSDSSYGSYNLLKEEFILIESLPEYETIDTIENTERIVDNELVEYRVLSFSFFTENKAYLLEVGKSIETIGEIDKSIQRFALFILLSMVLITALLDISITRILLRPLNLIINKKLKKASHPSLFNYDKVKTNTEDFAYLDESINEMLKKIEEAFSKEKEFIANASHELLTPVSILQNRLENLLYEPALSDEIKFKIIESQKTLKRLQNIIQALLLISKIENEQYIKNESFYISEIIKEVVEEIEERIEARNLSLSLNIKEDFSIKSANRSLLFTLFFNILNNAIKYNVPRGKIEITGSKNEDSKGYILSFKDSGIGVPEENLPFIFNRFRKMTQGDTESHGLGLAIVKTIADYHKIDIEVSSSAEGTTFKLLFRQ